MLKTFVGILSICGFILYFVASYAAEKDATEKMVPDSSHQNTKKIPVCDDKVTENKELKLFVYDYLALNQYLANQYLAIFKKKQILKESETELNSYVKNSLFVLDGENEICDQTKLEDERNVCKIITKYSKSHKITEALSVLNKEVYPETRIEDKRDDSISFSQNNPPNTGGDEKSQEMTPQSKQDEVTVEQSQPETPPSPLNTYDSIVKCVEDSDFLSDEVKQSFKDNLSQLEKELSSILEHPKPISLSLMIVDGMVPKKCLDNRLADNKN